MEDAWRGTVPSTPDDTFLPRIWAVYVRGNAPTDLPPHDARGVDIDARLAAKKTGNSSYTIRPARVAFEVRKPVPRNFLMEAQSEVKWGWVAESDLFGQVELGYKRKFLTPEGTRKRQRYAV
jgi:hypothetical protein